jgi:hypothetical protein
MRAKKGLFPGSEKLLTNKIGVHSAAHKQLAPLLAAVPVAAHGHQATVVAQQAVRAMPTAVPVHALCPRRVHTAPYNYRTVEAARPPAGTADDALRVEAGGACCVVRRWAR